MPRRILALSTLVLALAAAPAFADDGSYHLYTQMANGSATSSRHAGGCTIDAGAHGSLALSCRGGARATLVYTFRSERQVRGNPMGRAYALGSAHVNATATASGRTIHLTVTVSGGSATISSVCVSYYA